MRPMRDLDRTTTEKEGVADMKKLDRNKPFGVVCGEHSAAFEQDGTMFDAYGEEIGTESEVVAAPTETIAAPEATVQKEKAKPGRKPANAEKAKPATEEAPAASPTSIDEQVGLQGV